MAVCENCNGVAYVTETRRNQSGDVRRRFRCRSCDFAWTELNGIAPKGAAPEVRLSDEVILDILTDTSPQYVLADKHGCSASAIGRIRRGEMHANIHPEIPRFKSKTKTGRKTCRKCTHYRGIRQDPCDLGHRDPVEEGLTFASYCSNFTLIPKDQ
jgi:hypothetical protein